MEEFYGSPPPYSTNPRMEERTYFPSHQQAPPGPAGYAANYGQPASVAMPPPQSGPDFGYVAAGPGRVPEDYRHSAVVAPPQPAASAQPARPQAQSSRPQSSGPTQAQPGRSRGNKKKNQQPAPKQQARPKMQRANSAPSEISLCTKYLLFFSNFIFWIAGVGLIIIGVWAWLDRGFFGNLEEFVTSWYLDPILWFTVGGGIIFIMATFGCIGALRENICMLKTYSTVLGLMLLIEIGGGVAIYFYRTQIEQFVSERIDNVAIVNYRDTADFQDIIDGFQIGLQCCGVMSYNDWNMNVYFNCTTTTTQNRYNPEACGVPFSCCIRDPADTSGVVNTQCGYGVREPGRESDLDVKIYTEGCIMALKSWLSTNLVVVAVGAGAILLVQIFGFCFATSLTSDIKRQMSRWRRH